MPSGSFFCVHQIQRSACLPFKNGNYILKSLLAALVINLILLQPSYGGVSAGCINGRGPITILKTPSGSDLSVLPLWRSLYASPSAFTRLRNGSFTSFGLKSRFASTVLPQGHAYTVSGSGSCALGDSGGGSLSATGPDAGSTPQFSDFNSRQSSAASGYASIEPRSYSISTVAVGFPAKPVDSLLKSGIAATQLSLQILAMRLSRFAAEHLCLRQRQTGIWCRLIYRHPRDYEPRSDTMDSGRIFRSFE